MELVKNIFFNTDKIVENTEVKVTYAGTLFQNGSDSVNVHYGFGNNWDNAKDVPMEKTELGFQANIVITSGDTLNMCFNNSNGEWDNNYGSNYGFSVVKAESAGWNTTATATTTTGTASTTAWSSGTTPTTGTFEPSNWNTTNTTSTTDTTGTSSWNNTTAGTNTTVNNAAGYNYKTVPTGYKKTNASANIYGYNGTTNPVSGSTATTAGNSGVYGSYNVTGTTAGNNGNTTPNGESSIAVCTTPSWGDLFKKTFSNIKNYFSKVFGKGTGSVNNK
ncbi:MAG: hypothetical protein IKE01_00135 [Clostridia bacterium]|nr:hypothetical protein [Clostridia bacterium]